MAKGKPFWQQKTPLVFALRHWIERDLHRSVDDVKQVDVHEFTDQAIKPFDNVPITISFAEHSYQVRWVREQLVCRETHFAGFAHLLREEISTAFTQQVQRIESGIVYSGADFSGEIEHLIACRAYDLVRHALDCAAGGYEANWYLSDGEDMTAIPDIASLEEITKE